MVQLQFEVKSFLTMMEKVKVKILHFGIINDELERGRI
jgi:hypothetical protein